MTNEYRCVYFKPWVGKAYHSGGIIGTRVLVLGESHYQWTSKAPDGNSTREIVQEITKSEYRKQFWTNIVIAFLNRMPSKSDMYEFWHSVVFYNYIQSNVGYGPRIRPTPQMWEESVDPFQEVLQVHKPHCIVVLGETLWNHLPMFGMQGPDLTVKGLQRDTWLYPVEDTHYALAGRIKHPSAGFSGWQWHPWVRATIELSEKILKS
ncbi:MAG: hypothetical protein ACFFCW_07560 [Candidatus Hodarchaeota archaeon]